MARRLDQTTLRMGQIDTSQGLTKQADYADSGVAEDGMGSEWTFDQRASTYDNLQWVKDVDFLQAMVRLLSEHVALASSIILDVATGTGAVAQALAHSDSNVIGADLSRPMLDQAVERTDGVHYIQARGEALPIASKTMDLVVSRNGLHQMADPRLAAQEMQRVLKGTGLICLIESVAPEGIYDYWRQIIILKDRGRHEDFVFTAPQFEDWIESQGMTVIDSSSHDIEFDVGEWITMGGVEGARAAEIKTLFESAPPSVVSAMEIRRNPSGLTAKKRAHITVARPRGKQ